MFKTTVDPNTPPCVHSKRLFVFGQNVHNALHGSVLGSANWVFPQFFSVPHNTTPRPHHMHSHTHNTTTTQHQHHSHLAPHHCGDQVRCSAMKSCRYAYTVRSLSTAKPRVFVKRMKAATMRYGCILHLPTLVAIAHRSHRATSTKKSTPHREQSDHSHNS